MAKRTDSSRRIVDAAMKLAAERGWRSLPMAEVAAEAGLSLAELRAVFPTRDDILVALGRLADEAMLAGDDLADADEPARDRLFDRVMRRFDALQPYRAGIRRLFGELPRDPVAGLAVLPGILRSMAWTLESAGIPAAGLRGAVRAKALGFIYLRSMRVWLDDDSPDLSRTMAALDAQLRRAERFSSALRPRRASGAEASAQGTASAAPHNTD